MCDCLCSSCCGSSHCGSCSGERGKELRGGKYNLCNCKLRNGIQDGCSRIICKNKISNSNERSQNNKQRSSALKQQDQTKDVVGDFHEQKPKSAVVTDNQNSSQFQNLRLPQPYNNGLGDGLRNYNQMQMNGMRLQSANNGMLGSYFPQNQQPSYNTMFVQNPQMNSSYINPPNAASNYFTPTNQPTPYNFPVTSYNQANQLDLNTMLNQTQFKEPNDAMQMYYQGNVQQLSQLPDSTQLKNQLNVRGDNQGQGDTSNLQNINNNINEFDGIKNTVSTANVNYNPYNNNNSGRTHGTSMLVIPPNTTVTQPITFQSMNDGNSQIPTNFESSNGTYGNMQISNNIPANGSYYPSMTVVLNLHTKANYLNNDNGKEKNFIKDNKIIKKKFK